MLRTLVSLCVALAFAASALAQSDAPRAEISNGTIAAKFYLPDPDRGYYRGTRFDWSGQIHSLEYKNHQYFGQWFERYDPKLHDAIMGPVEEYRTGDSALGYEEAAVGGKFIRIGIGAVRKPDDKRFASFRTYDIVNPGQWKVKKGRDWIEFTHLLTDDTGYGYVYKKKIRLVKGKPEMALEHSIKNTGRKVIETSQYNHNFFVMDSQPTGPDFVVKFPFDVQATRDLKGDAEVRDKELAYLRVLEKGQSVYTELKGFGASPSDYDIRIENRKIGAGVRIRGDMPLEKIVYWSIRTTLCPEPYVKMRIEPGKEHRWRIDYEFYTM